MAVQEHCQKPAGSVSYLLSICLTVSVPSKVRNCAIAQCHQTICAVKSHSRALAFQILCGLKIA